MSEFFNVNVITSPYVTRESVPWCQRWYCEAFYPFAFIRAFEVAGRFGKIILTCSRDSRNRPRSTYQYSNMAPRLSGQTSIFGVVFFVFESLLGIERQMKLKKFTILTRKPRSRVRILIYRTWPIVKHVDLCIWII